MQFNKFIKKAMTFAIAGLTVIGAAGTAIPIHAEDAAETPAEATPATANQVSNFTITKNVTGDTTTDQKQFNFETRGYAFDKATGEGFMFYDDYKIPVIVSSADNKGTKEIDANTIIKDAIPGQEEKLKQAQSDYDVTMNPKSGYNDVQKADAKDKLDKAQKAVFKNDADYDVIFTVQERRRDFDKDYYNYDYDLSTGYYVVYQNAVGTPVEDGKAIQPTVFKTNLTLPEGADEEEGHIRRMFQEEFFDVKTSADVQVNTNQIYTDYKANKLGAISVDGLVFNNGHITGEVKPFVTNIHISNKVTGIYDPNEEFTFVIQWRNGEEWKDGKVVKDGARVDTQAAAGQTAEEPYVTENPITIKGTGEKDIPITFQKSGIYTFVIKEIPGTNKDIDYDTTQYLQMFTIKKRHNIMSVKDSQIVLNDSDGGCGNDGSNDVEGISYIDSEEMKSAGACLFDFEKKFSGIEFNNVSHKAPKPVTVTKVDANNNPVKNAKLEVLNKDGKAVAQWTSDDKAYVIDGSKLVNGATYTVRELEAPQGYEKAKDITFVYDANAGATIKVVDVATPKPVVTPKPTPKPTAPKKEEAKTSVPADSRSVYGSVMLASGGLLVALGMLLKKRKQSA